MRVNTFWISIVVIWICGWVICRITTPSDQHKEYIKKHGILVDVLMDGFAGLVFPGLYCAIVLTWWVVTRVAPGLPIRLPDATAAVAAIASGVGAFLFKKRNQKLYGIVEIAFAWFTAASVSTKISSGHAELASWLAFGSAVYIASRGWDNFVKGIDEQENAKSKI